MRIEPVDFGVLRGCARRRITGGAATWCALEARADLGDHLVELDVAGVASVSADTG